MKIVVNVHTEPGREVRIMSIFSSNNDHRLADGLRTAGLAVRASPGSVTGDGGGYFSASWSHSELAVMGAMWQTWVRL